MESLFKSVGRATAPIFDDIFVHFPIVEFFLGTENKKKDIFYSTVANAIKKIYS